MHLRIRPAANNSPGESAGVDDGAGAGSPVAVDDPNHVSVAPKRITMNNDKRV
jgi:hypothetical protein